MWWNAATRPRTTSCGMRRSEVRAREAACLVAQAAGGVDAAGSEEQHRQGEAPRWLVFFSAWLHCLVDHRREHVGMSLGLGCGDGS